MTGFDLSTITGCYVGSTPATAIYWGATKIWPASQHDYSQDYLTIVSLEDNNVVKFYADDVNYARSISISTDNGSTWTQKTPNTLDAAHYYVQLATLNTGNKLLIKGNNSTYGCYGIDLHPHWLHCSKQYNVEGNILSLTNGDNFISATPNWDQDAFYYFFSYYWNGDTTDINNKLISAEHLILPNYTKDFCYDHMFSQCTALTTAPVLPATTLTTQCYFSMFFGCSSLNYIKCLATDLSATNCITYWTSYVAASGTFIKDASTTWPTGSSGIPTGWTTEDAA